MSKLEQATIVFAQEVIKAKGIPQLKKVRGRFMKEVDLTEKGANSYFYKIKKDFA